MSFIIGVSGGSGSGKTSFVKDLAQAFDETEITLLSQDDYYKPREKQKIDNRGVINFDLPSSIYLKQFVNDINQLCEGKEVHRLEYTFNNDEASAKNLVFKPTPIILVEGLFIFHAKKIRTLLDLKVLIQAKVSHKIIRRILRDKDERNYPLDDVLYRYQNHVMPAFEKYIYPYQDKVDIIINNNKSYTKGLDVMKSFIQKKLSEQQK
jgi:uridine kinase